MPEEIEFHVECKAMVLCRNCERIGESGIRFNLHDCFGTIENADFPLALKPLFLYLQLTGDPGAYEFELRFEDLADGSMLHRIGGTQTRLWNPFYVEHSFHDLCDSRITIPHPGEDDVVLLLSGQEVQRIKFKVEAPV